MKNKQFIRALAAALAFILTMAVFYAPIYANPNFERDHVTSRNISTQIVETSVTGQLPLIANMRNEQLMNSLNSRISQIADGERALVTEATRSLTFWYEVFTGGANNDIVSILVFAKRVGTTSTTNVSSVNFSTATERMVGLTSPSVLGQNAVQLANRHILQTIRQNPEIFTINFAGVSDGIDFAADGDTIILYFDEFQLAPGSPGVVTIEMERNSVINLYLSRGEYFIHPSHLYNLKMIELRTVAAAFGYTMTWDSINRRVFIYRDRQLATTLRIGINEFHRGRSAIRPLEAAPEIVDGRTQVPISFFSEILDQVYSVDSLGTITFSEYRPRG